MGNLCFLEFLIKAEFRFLYRIVRRRKDGIDFFRDQRIHRLIHFIRCRSRLLYHFNALSFQEFLCIFNRRL